MLEVIIVKTHKESSLLTMKALSYEKQKKFLATANTRWVVSIKSVMNELSPFWNGTK
jgi:hypothetical protein